ncbi:MAG: hydrogenase maturation nickel metallochaperone HypA [Gammaproteobacteria bacterium]|nr:hydrogenase maturation nickel metallochaperone HypA [Gammaproteobacteria bacterium]MBU1647279.1 hydrogenase maturation nickel metallochaperone HypA [Gammaproteobacteria bacterium]MBU1972791.1 hydrogenase maturation nickel metallochaperone HypA [Gammaproteobacteria bacterium]
MHEMSLAEGILDLVEDAARREGFGRVRTVFLEIGRLSSVEPEAMAFCFDAVVRDSIADGAKLEIIDVPGSGLCLDCGRETELEVIYDPCQHCGAAPVKVTGGTEMRVRELDVE